MFKCNDERIRIKGSQGLPAQITLNGKAGTINDHIVEGDRIEVILATQGIDGEAQISDYANFDKVININGTVVNVPLVRLNGEWLTKNQSINEGDLLEIMDVTTLEDLLYVMKYSITDQVVTVNSEIQPMSYELIGGDTILVGESVNEEAHEVMNAQNDLTCLSDLGDLKQQEVPSDEAIDAEECKCYQEETVKSVTKVEVPEKANLYIMVNGKMIQLPYKESDYILASIFDFIDFDLTKPQGTIQLIRNGESAGLADVLKNGDTLEIYWKK